MKRVPSKKWSLNPKIFVISISIAALVAFGIYKYTKFNFWACFGIVVLAMLANGWLATVEDDMPGGLNNPGKKK